MKALLRSNLLGTTAMTLYSIVISEKEQKNFVEPEILGQLIQEMLPIGKQPSRILGWSSHYAVGLLFTKFYQELWENGLVKPTIKNGILLGAASGGIGVLMWKATLKMHPAPPRIKLDDFYRQLVVAHVVFGIFATVGYRK